MVENAIMGNANQFEWVEFSIDYILSLNII